MFDCCFSLFVAVCVLFDLRVYVGGMAVGVCCFVCFVVGLWRFCCLLFGGFWIRIMLVGVVVEAGLCCLVCYLLVLRFCFREFSLFGWVDFDLVVCGSCVN